jgi:hypothetical protein
MSTRAHRICCPYRYRPAPIRAAFALSHHELHFCARCRHQIWRNRASIDSFNDGIIWMTDLIVTSCQRRIIQIPIAMRSTLTPTQHPAVSSLEASPTPAH